MSPAPVGLLTGAVTRTMHFRALQRKAVAWLKHTLLAWGRREARKTQGAKEICSSQEVPEAEEPHKPLPERLERQ